MQPKKQLKFQYICIFEEIDSFFFLYQKCTSKKRAKKFGHGYTPPPSFGQCLKENVFFSVDPFPN